MTRLALELSLPAVAALKGGGGAAASSAAAALLGSETDGLAYVASDDSMEIRDTVTPANNYSGSAITKFGSVRASAGTYFDVSGILQSSASGLRRNYNPALSNAPEYLVEAARTNLVLGSNSFPSYWIEDKVTCAQNVTGIDGTTSAWTMTDDTATGEHRLYQGGMNIGNGDSRTLYAKAGTASFLGISGTGASCAVFNLSTGTIAVPGAVNATIEPAVNGFYRCGIARGVAADQYFMIYIGRTAAEATAGTSWTGTGTNTIIITDAQCEAATSASSYIPVTTVAVTRAGDSAGISTTQFNWPNTQPVTIYSRYVHPANSGYLYYHSDMPSGTIQLYTYYGTPTLYDNSAMQIIWGSTPAINTVNKMAGAIATNNSGFCVNGGTTLTSAAANYLQNVSAYRMYGGGVIGVREGMQLRRRMSNAELTTLTT